MALEFGWAHRSAPAVLGTFACESLTGALLRSVIFFLVSVAISTEMVRKYFWIINLECKLYVTPQNCFPVPDIPLSMF